MSFTSRITRAPLPYDPARAAQAVKGRDDPAALHDLIAGTAGCSPYLFDLLVRERAWFDTILDVAPEDTLAAVLGGLETAAPEHLGTCLREAKRRVALLAALCDLGGVWGLDEVMGALTRLADCALDLAVDTLVRSAQRAGRLPQVPARDGGLFVIAMGKLGARELNYSSDIDLIFLFDESLYPAEDYQTIRKQFIRITQEVVKVFGTGPTGGYVFRTDLRLRPDPSVTPVCIGMAAAERYYESQGRTWERAALIRARIAAGDRAAGVRFLDSLSPFVWRKHLDFAAIHDAHDIRLRIRDHKGLGGAFHLPGHNVKLGQGGIREIEFLIQTKQLICGGRDPDLRDAGTRPALTALADKGWIPRDVADQLYRAYAEHRTLEHRLQMLDDAQTHSFPLKQAARARLAAFCGAPDPAAFEAEQARRFVEVRSLVEGFFSMPSGPQPSPEIPADPWASFPDPETTRKTITGWSALPALRTDRGRASFERLAPAFAARLSGAADPGHALSVFDRFLRGLPAGIQVFALFEANPMILDLLVDVCATAPRLADYLGQNPQVLDAVLSPSFFEPSARLTDLKAELDRHLDAAEDYERCLDAARVWAREQWFRTGVQVLRQTASPVEAGADYSVVAEAVLQALLPYVTAEIAGKHGPPPGDGAAILAMGKLGSAEMTARSDLDLIIVYDASASAESDGPRPLAATAWYARFAQALVAALSAPTARGVLYDVDMRLRPSGRQGPVAVALAGFARYQAQDAWTWEHLALTRARVVAGAPQVCTRLNSIITDVLAAPPRPDTLKDVRDMRARLAEAKAGDGPWALKDGRGGILDIELLLQAGRLLTPSVTAVAPLSMVAELQAAGWITAAQSAALADHLGRLLAVQQVTRLALDGAYDPERGGPGLAALLADVTGFGDIDALERALISGRDRAASIVESVLRDDQT
ncbi:MAG: bifunctional [glutamine synthetase] adenylyltransferase/[glutamine synthetase]-adenylyl-L-tyrosine phosphorylase [Pseudomonadota bacterium]